MADAKIRILIAKPGLDGHDRGAKVIARALMDAGFEVIYTGIRKTPEEIARIALEEDVGFVGLSLLSGAHNELFPMVAREIKKLGLKDVKIFGGGVIPEADVQGLLRHGMDMIFPSETPTEAVIDYIRQNAKTGRG
ncbi:MAG: cobalamin B12-binding domain-containing protein [Oligoflexia bacterium]|nr:cobalamin B12-binding domain-containing protein [Oligoflexia bacterium]